jgi:hypothetical protein
MPFHNLPVSHDGDVVIVKVARVRAAGMLWQGR